MGPLQSGVNVSKIERPPYYHPPRSRPVAFEEPSRQSRSTMPNCSKIEVLIKHNHLQQAAKSTLAPAPAPTERQFGAMHHQQQHQYQQQQLYKPPDYNNLPKPFCRSPHPGGGGPRSHSASANYGQTAPRILINDQSSLPNPTSTVHKSMLGSQSPIDRANAVATANSYARLISPTIMSASTDTLPLSVSRSINMDNSERQSRPMQYQQQHQHQANHNLISESDAALSSAFTCSPTNTQASSSRDGSRLAASEFLQANLPHFKQQGNSSQNNNSIQSNLATMQNNSNLASLAQLNSQQQTLLARANFKAQGSAAASAYSNSILPDTKRDEYMWNKQLERVSIAHQTYRTLPIVRPKPKARHDLASGTYMQHTYDPTWDLVACNGQLSRPGSRGSGSAARSKDYEKKIQQAISGGCSGGVATGGSVASESLVCGQNSSGSCIKNQARVSHHRLDLLSQLCWPNLSEGALFS